MGDIADSMINGDFDFHTGEYIGKGKGIPRTRDKSLFWEKRNTKSAYNGVMKFLVKKGISNTEDRNAIVYKYCMEYKLKITNVYSGCSSISANFSHFAHWYNNQKSNQ